MVNTIYKIVWTKTSQQHLKQIFEHISKDSPKNASKVIKEITEVVNKASYHPEINVPDRYKINNDGSYRAFEKHRY